MAAYTRNEGWRPRRGKPADFPARQGDRPRVDPAFLLKDLEQRVATLSLDDTGYASEFVRVRHVKPVASYSWIDAPVPTIAVPGSPRIWPDRCVRQVPLDKGVHYIHHDASKMGDHSPMLPLFAAIDAMHDDFAYADLDFVTDRNGLRKLLRHVDGASAEDDFRIDVDLVGKTCLFTRREESMTRDTHVMGYGHEYLRAATRVPSGCERMIDHHRIITYKFGSLDVLLSFTADACIDREDDELITFFKSLGVNDTGPAKGKKSEPSERVFAGIDVKVESRSLVAQSDLIEVKTRSKNREPDWSDIYPQLFLSQTAWLYLARHTRGVFDPVERISLTGEEMRPHAKAAEESLGKLKILLKEILKAVRAQGGDVSLSLVRQGGTLSLWRRKKGSGKPVGEEIRSRFARKAVR